MATACSRRRPAPGRSLVAIVAATALLLPLAASPVAAATFAPGAVAVAAGAAAVNDPNVTLTLSPPTDAASIVRISNDGSTWIERPWAPSIGWSLTDPAGGGTPGDGEKTVSVAYGDGTDWSVVSSDAVIFDTLAPQVIDYSINSGATTSQEWIVMAGGGLVDNGSGTNGSRLSLDGIHWSEWESPGSADLRDLLLGGNWQSGTRTVWFQARDWAGNVTEPLTDTIELAEHPTGAYDDGPMDVRFAFPRPAVTGELFTITPIFPTTLPDNAWCQWMLHWGDDEALHVQPNETFGELLFERQATRGGCGSWTFTLPWNAPRQYELMLQVLTKTPAQEKYWGYGDGLYSSPPIRFDAELGTTSQLIATSSILIAYLLPEFSAAGPGDPMTYRLRAVGPSGSLTVPQTGQFWAYPLGCYLNPHFSQTGGTTFTFEPICAGSWVAGWTGTYLGGYMRSQYDPIADGRAPSVGTPVVRLRQGATFGSSAPVSITWTAKDSGSGLFASELAISRNGGSYVTVPLASRLSLTTTRTLALDGTYRVRVRARDRAGNWSRWIYGPTLSARALQENASTIRYSAGWGRVLETGSFGGGAMRSTQSGATAGLTFSGRSIAWLARGGADRGLAQVRIDGTLVATVDLARLTTSRALAFSKTWSTSGTHTISVRVLGTAGRPAVDVDAFVVLR